MPQLRADDRTLCRAVGISESPGLVTELPRARAVINRTIVGSPLRGSRSTRRTGRLVPAVEIWVIFTRFRPDLGEGLPLAGLLFTISVKLLVVSLQTKLLVQASSLKTLSRRPGEVLMKVPVIYNALRASDIAEPSMAT